MKIPFFHFKEQKEYLHKIDKFNLEIDSLLTSKEDPVIVINQVFGEAIGFNWEEFENIKREKTYRSGILDFANNIDCRMGILEQITNNQIKDFISEPIILGKSVSPKDYDEDGEYYYIAMSNIKTWAFDPEDCKKVTEDYASSNMNKTVQKREGYSFL